MLSILCFYKYRRNVLEDKTIYSNYGSILKFYIQFVSVEEKH